MDARLKTPEDTRPLTREEYIVETVLEIIGAATVIEDGIERRIGPHDISAVSPTGGLPDHAAAPRASRSRQCGRPVNGFSKAKARLDQLMATLARAEGRQLAAWLLHDLRRTAATGMTELRILPHIIEIEAVLNHVSGHKAGVAGSRPPNVTALRRKPVS